MRYVFVFALGLAGLIASLYIYYKKYRKEKLVCVIGNDCDKVVHSRYSTMLGVPNEVLGVAYYAFILFISSLLIYGFGSVLGVRLALVLLLASGFAAFFSAVLIYIQAFVLKEWCEYCIISAGISVLIFFAEIL